MLLCRSVLLQVLSYSPFLFSLCKQSVKRRFIHPRVSQRSVDGLQGRCMRSWANLCCVMGLKPVFFSCVCARGIQVWVIADRTMFKRYTLWRLTVWQQHIIISLGARTEWSLQPHLPAAVCSVLIYTLNSSVIWSHLCPRSNCLCVTLPLRRL